MKNQKGFSLIELLIVVVIIGIIAAIAIPNLLAARRSANEGSATATLRTLTGAQATFQSTSPTGDFGTATELNTAGLIDSQLAALSKAGYAFTIGANPRGATAPATFDHTAIPQQHGGIGATGTRSFYSNESGVIYANVTAAAPTVNATTRAVTGGDPINP